MRIPVIFFIGYILLTFLIPIRRIVPDTELSPFFQNVFGIHVWIPILLAIFVVIREKSPSLNKIAKISVWNWLTVIILLFFLAFTVLGIKGLWWTWITLGVHFSTVMLVANATRSKLGDLRSLVLGVAVASFAAGLWEVGYQIGYYQNYDASQGVSSLHMYTQIIQISPLTIGGLSVAITFYKPKISWLPVSLLVLSMLLFSYWVLGTMWVDVIFNWEERVWIQTQPFRWDQAILYRSSKAILAFGLIGLYGAHHVRDRGIRLRLLVGYAIIPLWIGFFIITSAFLVFTWVKSLFSSEGKLPYFKTRTIHYDRRFDSPNSGGRNE